MSSVNKNIFMLKYVKEQDFSHFFIHNTFNYSSPSQAHKHMEQKF